MAENSTSDIAENPTENKPAEISTELKPAAAAPLENPTENDTNRAENNSPQVGLFEKIRNAGESAAASFKIPFRKGKGRPKNCRACGNEIGKRENCPKCKGTGVEPGKGDTVLPPGGAGAPRPSSVQTDLAAPPGPAPGEPRPAGSFLLRRVVVSGVKAAKGVSRYVLESKAHEAGIDDDFTDKAFERAKPTDEMWKNLDESTGLVLQKYNIKTEHDELACFVTDLGAIFACDFALLRTFNKEIARRRKKERGED